MKHVLFMVCLLWAGSGFGQGKYSTTQFDKLTEVKGSKFVIASVNDWSKNIQTKDRYLLFINTATGESNQMKFPLGSKINQVEQVKIDELGINLILVEAQTVDLDGKTGIDWNDPTQLIILPTSGEGGTKLTEDSFFVRKWSVNETTGTIVVTGYSNNASKENKYNRKSEQNEIRIYDLKSLKLMHNIK
ncbi:MAG: hypothetical protein ACK5JS_04690 [Mangrovibacterium sp.]